MKIGVAGPVDLRLLQRHFSVSLPDAYSFPLIADNVNELVERGHQLTVFALSDEVSSPKFFSSESADIAIHVLPQRETRSRTLDLFRQERRLLTSAINSSDLDVVHANWTYEFGWAAAKSRFPAVVTAHDAPLLMAWQIRSAYRTSRTLLSWRAVRESTRIAAVSPGVALHLANIYGARASVVANPVPRPLIASPASSQHPGNNLRFVSIANDFDSRKNTSALLLAFAYVRQQRPHATLSLLGRGHGVGEAAWEYARRRGLCDGVEFVGSVGHERVLEYLLRPDTVMVHSSLWEACCMAIAEALVMGVPVIAGARSGGVPWQLNDGDAGVLVDVKDPRQIAAAMLRLGSPTLRISIGISGSLRGRALHGYDAWTDSYESLYQQAAHRGGEATRHEG